MYAELDIHSRFGPDNTQAERIYPESGIRWQASTRQTGTYLAGSDPVRWRYGWLKDKDLDSLAGVRVREIFCPIERTAVQCQFDRY